MEEGGWELFLTILIPGRHVAYIRRAMEPSFVHECLRKK